MGKETSTVLQPSKDEVAMVKILATGATNNEIASKLNLELTKVISNLYILRIKYGCKNSIELVAVFLREGFID
jgi:DNA-binding CsgD family transcriptional regulator